MTKKAVKYMVKLQLKTGCGDGSSQAELGKNAENSFGPGYFAFDFACHMSHWRLYPILDGLEMSLLLECFGNAFVFHSSEMPP